MLEVAAASVAAYIGTNIDDLFINTFFFAQSRSKKQDAAVVFGKYLSVFSLIAVSVLAASGLQFIPTDFVGLLGLIPIALGVRAVFDKDTDDDTPSFRAAGVVLHVFAVTWANSADNIGVYIPLFTGYGWVDILVLTLVFSVMTALWLWVSKKLADLPVLRTFLLRYKRVIVPIVFFTLGIYILLRSGSLFGV